MASNGDGGETFDDQLEALGFRAQGASKRGGTMWVLDVNRHLTFTLHDYREDVVLTWSFGLGEYLLEQGMQVGAGETTFQELYPQHDVKLPVNIESVGAEITRVLSRLRFDLGDPSL